MARFAAVGAGRMGRGIAIAFAYAGHRIALVDLRRRSPDAWQRLCEQARTEIRASLDGLAQLVILPIVQAAFRVVDDFEASSRGAGGFGSSGRR